MVKDYVIVFISKDILTKQFEEILDILGTLFGHLEDLSLSETSFGYREKP